MSKKLASQVENQGENITRPVVGVIASLALFAIIMLELFSRSACHMISRRVSWHWPSAPGDKSNAAELYSAVHRIGTG